MTTARSAAPRLTTARLTTARLTTATFATAKFAAGVVAAGMFAAGCTSGTPDPADRAAADAVTVVDSRLVEGADLCALAAPEELEWLLGKPLTDWPAPDPADPGTCTATFTGTEVAIAGRTSASGVRAVVEGNTAFTETGDDGCRVSVALLPGGTVRAGSYLSVSVGGADPEQRPLDCRTAGRIAGHLLRLLPKH